MCLCVFVVFCVSSVLWAFYVYFEMRVSEEEKQTHLCDVWVPLEGYPTDME